MGLFVGGFVWRVVITGRAGATNWANVYHYGNGSSVGSAADLAAAWVQDILPGQVALASTDCDWDRIEVTGIRGIFDLLGEGIGVDGDVGDTLEPSFVCYSFRYNRAASNERHGYKRLPGVPDEAWSGGEIDPTYETNLIAYAAVLDNSIAATTPVYVPLIERKQFDGNPVVPSEYYTFTTCTFLGISTQNSRKAL